MANAAYVFQNAERLAAELHQCRSQLYSQAVREYVAQHSTDAVIALLDAVYTDGEDEAQLGFLQVAAGSTLENSEW